VEKLYKLKDKNEQFIYF